MGDSNFQFRIYQLTVPCDMICWFHGYTWYIGICVVGLFNNIKAIFKQNMYRHFNLSSKCDMNVAGLPPTIVFGATSFVTTDPAATIEFSPTVTPGRMVELEPIHVLSFNIIGFKYMVPLFNGL